MFVDVTAGGSLLDKTPTKAKKLQCKMVGDDHVEVANEKLVHVFSEFTILIALPKVQI